jgi:predicted transcriptional regulator
MSEQQQQAFDLLMLRRKCEAVLYSIEMAIGEQILKRVTDVEELPSSICEPIIQRMLATGDESASVKRIIEETYFQEVCDMLPVILEGSLAIDAKQLKNLVELLGIPSVRNAVSHPNRPFHESYWYSVAALASSPAAQRLGLEAARNALLDAEAGRLYSPPEKWINRKPWRIPGNLPNENEFDFGGTGLIGREKISEEIKSFLKRKRNNLVSIVAPGGTGKTALALSILNEVTQTPEYLDAFTDVLFFSAKEEALSTSGITQISTLEAIKSAINEYLCSAAKQHESSDDLRLLICIDNLETLIRDKPDEFEQFYEDVIHDNWLLLVTSRVAVNNSKGFALSDLDKKAASHLARRYSSLLGLKLRSQDDIDSIVNIGKHNPLSIKLTIEHLAISPSSIAEAAALARDATTDFAFRNLISSLSVNSKRLLECIFAAGLPVSRNEACHLLDMTMEDVSEAVMELRRTSLVSFFHQRDTENIEIQPAARDFMVSSPVDLEARRLVEKRKAKGRVQQEHYTSESSSPLHPEYIPSELDAVHTARVCELMDYLRSRDRQQWDIARKKAEAFCDVGNLSIYKRIEGIARYRLKDLPGSIECLTKAFEAGDKASGLRLSYLFRTSSDFDNAVQVAERIWNEMDEAEFLSDPLTAKQLALNYFVPLVYKGEYQDVLDRTEHHLKSDGIGSVIGSIRAQAHRERAQAAIRETAIGDSLWMEDMIKAMDMLNTVFARFGYRGEASEEAWKLVTSLPGLIAGSSSVEAVQKVGFELVEFCVSHLRYIKANCRKASSERCLGIANNLKHYRTDSNAESLAKMIEYWNTIADLAVEAVGAESPDTLVVSVSKIPRNKLDGSRHAPYLFAVDQQRNRYYINQGVMEFGDLLWDEIDVGDLLEIQVDVSVRSDTVEQQTQKSIQAISAKYRG